MTQFIRVLKTIWFHPLNKNQRISSILRFFRWQIATRLIPGSHMLPFVGDTFLLSDRGMAGATGNWYCGLLEPNEMGFCLHTLDSNSHFLDIGANIGSYTILVAGATGAKVTSIEPIPTTCRRLKDNVYLNRLNRLVTVHMMGLSDKEETLKFSSELDSVNHVLTEHEQIKSVEINVTTLDSLIPKNDCPDLIKIDAEGYEYFILKGANSILENEKLKAVIIEINSSGIRYGISDEHLIKTLNSHGFNSYSYDPIERKLSQTTSTDSNLIFIRDLESTKNKIKNAPTTKLINGEI